MTPRYRIKFSGMPHPGLVRWLQELIPVLREAPRDVEIDVEIKPAPKAESESSGSRRDEAG